MDRKSLAVHILAAGLGFVFIMFGIWKFTDPLIWKSFMPRWIDGFLSLDVYNWLSFIGTIELLLGVAVIIPVRKVRRVATALIAIHLVAVIVMVGWNDVGVRDIGLFLSSVALLLLL
jgi:uncharacterized membrane protein